VSCQGGRRSRYLRSQRLGRIATVDPRGRPRVVPTGFRYNAETGTIDLSGANLASTRRYQDVQQNPHVAFVVDDLVSTDPWRPRAVHIRGTVTIHEPDDPSEEPWMRLTPTSVSSFGLDHS
jgi:pyridoxamine 5'-phosphate oxidase family protein